MVRFLIRGYSQSLTMMDGCSFEPVIVAPTFNNGRTLARILRGIDLHVMPAIVVDDGSTDDTASILKTWRGQGDGRVVITHTNNRGKAEALLCAFRRAAEMGFTHAVTIDTDGQLDPAQISDLLRGARRWPGALVVGRRDFRAPGYDRASRLGRWICNLLVRWQSGARLSDSQCGMRVYPLASILGLRCRARRYGYETEVITRAAWEGIAIRQVRVDCVYNVPGGRVSHFRPWLDSLRGAGMHIRLLATSILPHASRPPPKLAGKRLTWRRVLWWVNPARIARMLRDQPAERVRFAKGVAVGVFIGNLPLYGIQTLLCLFAARKMRLGPLPVICGSHISTPPLGPLLIAAAVAVGHVILHGELPRWKAFDPAHVGYMKLLRSVLLEWGIGSVVCGAALATVAYFLTRLVLRWAIWRMPADPAPDRGGRALTRDRAVEESAV